MSNLLKISTSEHYISDGIVFLKFNNNNIQKEIDIMDSRIVEQFASISNDHDIINFIDNFGWLGYGLRKKMINFYKKHHNFVVDLKISKNKPLPICRVADIYEEVETLNEVIKNMNYFHKSKTIELSFELIEKLQDDYDFAITTINEKIKSIHLKLCYNYLNNKTEALYNPKNALEAIYLVMYHNVLNNRKTIPCPVCGKLFTTSNAMQNCCTQKCTHKLTKIRDNNNIKNNPIRNLRKRGIAHIEYMTYKKLRNSEETTKIVESFKHEWSVISSTVQSQAELCEKFDNLCRRFCQCKKCIIGYSKHIYP